VPTLLENLAVRIGYEVDEGGKRKVEQQIDGLAAKSVAAGDLMASAIKKGAELALGAIKGLAKGLSDLITDVAEAGGELDDLSIRLGVSVEAIQELGYAAKLGGASMGELQGALLRMQRGLSSARAEGTQPFEKALQKIGLRLSEIDGLAPDAQFEAIAEALSKTSDTTTRTGAAMDIFGKGVVNLLPLINDGAGGIQRFREEFRQLGGGFTTQGAKAAAEFGDMMDRLGVTINSVKIAIALELMPIVEDYIGELQAWVRENGDLVRQKVTEFVQRFAEVVRELAPLVLRLVEGIGAFIDRMGGAEETIIAVTAALGLMKLATLAGAGPYGVLAAAGFAAGMAIVDAFSDAAEQLEITKQKTRELGNEARRIAREIEQTYAKFDRETEEADKKESERRRKLTEGFAPELLKNAGEGLRVMRTGDAETINAALLSGARTSARKEGAAVERAARRRGMTAEQARERGKLAEQAALRKASEAFPRAREAASAAFLGGSSAESAARAGLRSGGKTTAKGGGGRRASSGGSSGPGLLESFGFGAAPAEGGILDSIGDALGRGGMGALSNAGRGASPIAGTSFSRIDASLNAPVTVTVNVPPGLVTGKEGAEAMRAVGGHVAEATVERLRKLYDFHQSQVRSL
jgi:hypothetical protein